MGFPLISVALCTRNGTPYLRAQLILAQTLLPMQIVLCDDASTDATVALAREVLDGSAVALRVIENAQPLGVTANFERAILACESPLVVLCDQDDVWIPTRLERAAQLFESRPGLELVHSDATLIDGEGRILSATLFGALSVGPTQVAAIHAGAALELLLRRNLVTGATMMIRRSLAERATPFPSAWLHDEWLATVAAATGEVDVINEQLIAYRQHGANQVGVARLGFAAKVRRMLEPGTLRNRRLLQRAEQLEARFERLDGVTHAQLEAVREKLRHERVRAALPLTRIRRLRTVAAELRSGRYSRFGRGPADAVRDVVQPLNPAS